MTVCGVHGCRNVASGASRLMLGEIVAFVDAAATGTVGAHVEVQVPVCQHHDDRLRSEEIDGLVERAMNRVPS